MGYRLIEYFEQNRGGGARYMAMVREWTPDWVTGECAHLQSHTQNAAHICREGHMLVLAEAWDAALLTAAAALDATGANVSLQPGSAFAPCSPFRRVKATPV